MSLSDSNGEILSPCVPQLIFKMEIKTIKVSEKNWKKLMKWRIELRCKNLDEVINKILEIIPANKLKS